MQSKAARKYFESYATQIAPHFCVSNSSKVIWDRAVVIPARREFENLERTIASLTAAAQSHNLRTLIILVINGTLNEKPDHDRLAENFAARADIDLVVFNLDRHGVGFARKVGMDFAAQLFFKGRIRSPWLRTTDADVIVRRNYFEDPEKDVNWVAENYNFIHTTTELSSEAAAAHELYDLYLRYYVAGLKFANSPYAYHTIGSILSIHAEAYVQVRGFQDREAGEDFYILNKLSKVGRIHQRTDAAINILGRISDRVPFGTSRSVSKILQDWAQQKVPEFYDPKVFALLRDWILLLKEFASAKDEKIFETTSQAQILQFIASHNILDEIRRLPLESCNPEIRLRHLMNWFDSFRTLKFIHYIRDTHHPLIPWTEALRKAEFMPHFDPKSLLQPGRQDLPLGV